MNTEFEIIHSHLKKGSFTDCFERIDTRCLSDLSHSDVWMIQGHDGISAFFSLAQRIHSTKKIKSNYTIQHVEKVLNTLILNSIGKKPFTQKTIIDEARNQLPTAKAETFDIMRNIFGIKLSKNYRKIEPFTFQKGKNAYRNYFNKKSWNSPDIEKYISDYAVRYQVTSVTKERAIEIADDTFATLEYLFAFILGRKDCGHEVRILRQTKENSLFYILKYKDRRISTGRSRQYLVSNQIDLNDVLFKHPKIQKLFSVVPSQQLNHPIEKRLHNAVTWIGKGLFSDSSIESTISYCSALESLLIRDEKTIISPSIVASLSEYCAFFLGNTFNSRKEIISEVKAIYSERSAGTHGGKVISDSSIEETALTISRSMVFRLLELYPKEIKSEEDVIAYVDKLKYS